MSRLPVPGGDNDIWGDILNDFMLVEHNADGTHRVAVNPDATITSKGKVRLAGDLAGTADAPTVPGLAGKVNTSIATTKGDLLAATAASTLARVGVGADGQILVADSAQSAGIKWAASASFLVHSHPN